MTRTAATGTRKRHSTLLNLLALLLMWVAGIIGLYLLRNDAEKLTLRGWENLIVLGFIGTWRWSWLILHGIRSFLYRTWVFPRWRLLANRIPLEQLPRLGIVVVTYKEKPWITDRVFRAIANEAKTLGQPLVLVAVSTKEEHTAIRQILTEVDPFLHSIQFIPIVDSGTGKRGALADGLRALERVNLGRDSVVALMDGDSVLSPGSLRGSLPFFRLFPKIGGLTTDEMPEVQGAYLFSEWLHLRFCQRNQFMCSYAFSRKLLCLTGRFSLFRASAALHPDFATLLENDYLNDWLWGQFRFFSGDDKTTWYWLLRQGYDMIYVPDVMVSTIDTLSDSFWKRSYQNTRRWSGNMLRSGNRALTIGPRRVGWFIWYCVLDQRISIWTALITPGILSLALLERNWLTVSIICCWILVSRPIYLSVMFWGRKSRLKLIHLPIMLIAQWGTSAFKIWTQMHQAQQKWTNRHGDNGKSASGDGLKRWLKQGSAKFLLLCQVFSFVVFLFWQYGTLAVDRDLAGWWWTTQVMPQPAPTQVIQAIDRGVYPSDRRDDSEPLMALINSLPPTGTIQINLPIGEIDLFAPLEINRSNIFLKGKGTEATILQAHNFERPPEAILTVRPSPNQGSNEKLENVQLSGFTIELAEPDREQAATAIVLENVSQAALKNLRLTTGGIPAIISTQTEDVTLEYVVIEGKFPEEANAARKIGNLSGANTLKSGASSLPI